MPRRNRLLVTPLESRTTPVSGDLDPTFGTAGRTVLTVSAAPVDDDFFAVTTDGAGRIIAGGEVDQNMVVARFRPDGKLDPLFGNGGVVVIDGGGFDSVRGIFPRGDGSLLVGGTLSVTGGRQDLGVAEVSPTGTVVRTVRRHVGADAAENFASDMDVNPTTGDVYVTGFSGDDMAAVRFTADLAFAGDVTVNPGGVDRSRGSALDAKTGRLYLTGSVNDDTKFVLVRLNPDLTTPVIKTFDFGGDPNAGKAEQQGKDVVVDPAAGRVYVCGTADPQDKNLDFLVFATDLDLNQQGTFKRIDFGTNDDGIDRARRMVLDGKGGLVVVGRSDFIDGAGSFQQDVGIVRLVAATLAHDLTFSGDGKTAFNFQNDDRGFSVALDGIGRILIGGQSGPNPVVVRVLADDNPPPVPPVNTPPTISDVADVTVSAGTSTGPLSVVVADAQTPPAFLLLSARSSNVAVVPTSGVVVGGGGSGRTVAITPAAGASGSATITLTVTDADGATATDTFVVTVPPNSPPTISDVKDLSVAAGTASAPQAFTVADAQTAAAALVVTSATSNATLVPAAGVVIAGAGADRTVTITPAAGQTGTATITLTVTDGGGLTAIDTFIVTVTAPPNTPPTISNIPDAGVTAGTPTPSLTFTVGDQETPATALVVTGKSSDVVLVPANNVVFGGSGANRTVTVTPAAGRTGAATITVTVTDAGGLTASDTFVVTVGGNTPPTITPIGVQVGRAGQVIGPLGFTVADAETAAGSLTVAAVSGNTGVVPNAGLVLGGTGKDRTITVTPAAGRTGMATITVTVTDAGGLTAATAFGVTVTATGTTPVLVGFPLFGAGADRGSGTATLYNSDQSVRFAVDPFGAFTGGVRTAAADFNGDGVANLVVGTGPGRATQVRILDGKNQSQLFTIDPFEAAFVGGVYVAAGDVNGDGVPDLVITPDEGGGPRCRVFNGSGFGVLADFFGIDDPNFRGGARAAVGDVNGDGAGDLVVAAGFQGGPRVAAFSGKSLASGPVKLFNDFFAFEQTLRNGVFIAVGDLDGDGKAEVIAGGGPGGGPRVTAFSAKDLIASGGGTLTPVANFFGGNPDNRGGVRIAVKDLDGDVRADLVVGAGVGAGSRVTGYLGKDVGAAGTPAAAFDFDAFSGFTGGVFVG